MPAYFRLIAINNVFFTAFKYFVSLLFSKRLNFSSSKSESDEYRVGNQRGTGDSGLILLGNIDSYLMNETKNMFADLPEIFRASSLLDRFHGFIKGWTIPKMKENFKANRWALNSEYFSKIVHALRDELKYSATIDQLLEVPKNASTRDTEAIKRICTGFLKVLFPHVESADQISETEFETYCLRPAKEMRGVKASLANVTILR